MMPAILPPLIAEWNWLQMQQNSDNPMKTSLGNGIHVSLTIAVVSGRFGIMAGIDINTSMPCAAADTIARLCQESAI